MHLSIDLAAKEQDAPRIRSGDVYDHPDGGRFTRAIRPEQSKNPSGTHRQAKLLNRRKLTKTLADPLELYRYVVSCHLLVLEPSLSDGGFLLPQEAYLIHIY